MSFSFRAGLAATLLVSALLLFVNLGEPDIGSDEALYSYAVERILETGEWLTPRSLPYDLPFLEKPPLKFWMVAGGMRAGLLPRNETGMRLVDAAFGLAACVYVYLLGVRLGGALCGFVSALTLMAIEPFVFYYGLRSNNMEAALVLCYCGGMYHATRWLEAGSASAGIARSARWHMAVAAGYFVLGFLTKFVAALFLPLVVLTAACWRPGGRSDLRARWREVFAAAALAVVVIVPWFVYESIVSRAQFWHIILGTHVYQRLAGTLDPAHLHPWHFYIAAVWGQIAAAGVAILWVLGALRLAMSAWRGEPPVARLILLWALLPLFLISFGTSKVLHYAYPFFPPLALMVGYAAAWVILPAGEGTGATARSLRHLRYVLVALSVVGAGVAVATAFEGRLLVERGGVVLFRNNSLMRPAVFAVLMLAIAARGRNWPRLVSSAVLAMLLPAFAYGEQLDRLLVASHPIRATRDCLIGADAARHGSGQGVLSASGNILHHSYYYYLWRQGPFVIAPSFEPGNVLARLTGSSPETPVILRRDDYEQVMAQLPAGLGAARLEADIAVLFPARYGHCGKVVMDAGGRPLWQHAAR